MALKISQTFLLQEKKLTETTLVRRYVTRENLKVDSLLRVSGDLLTASA